MSFVGCCQQVLALIQHYEPLDEGIGDNAIVDDS
jgi:hypothetical protein